MGKFLDYEQAKKRIAAKGPGSVTIEFFSKAYGTQQKLSVSKIVRSVMGFAVIPVEGPMTEDLSHDRVVWRAS